MLAADLHTQFRKRDLPSRQILQLCAISDVALSRHDLAVLVDKFGWTDQKGRPFTKNAISQLVKPLLKERLLEEIGYGNIQVNPEIQDLAVQDSIRANCFETISDAVTNRSILSRYYQNSPARDLRIAFYRGNVDEFRTLRRGMKQVQDVGLLSPFNQDIFDGLDPALREMYLADVIPQLIVNPASGREVLSAFDELIQSDVPLEDGTLAAWRDVAVARGDLESLERLDKRTGGRNAEVTGCSALLRGDFDTAEEALAAVLPGGKRKSKLSPIGHLPTVLALMLALRHDTVDALGRARSIVSSASKAKKSHFAGAMGMLHAAISFKSSPSSPTQFISQVKSLCGPPLDTLLAGYVMNWLLTATDTTFRAPKLVPIANAYRKCGFDWLAAEAFGLAAKSTLKSAADQSKKYQECHARLGTSSLIDLVEPQPLWQQSLTAIAQLADASHNSSESSNESERLIWELSGRDSTINLDAFQQKRNGESWSKGRKVGRQRLYERFREPEFAFLTDQDRALCRAIETSTERNYYGYTETYFEFDDVRAARALIGHPRVFREGDRTCPLEIVEQQPQLIVEKAKGGNIGLSLEPSPKQEDESLRIIRDSHRVAMVFFSDRHLQLHRILDGKLTVPASAANRVVETIQPVASLVSVHSEIGAEAADSDRVDADSRMHAHLLPFQDEGLRIEFFVRPFGDSGPFCRPGEGGKVVFAKIGGRLIGTTRDLAEEVRQQEELVGACPQIAARMENDTSICFPSAFESLEALVELESMLAEERVTLHWPKGRRLQMAGSATESQFQVQIRKDRDWFAASGKLKVDRSLTIDMMKLIELVESSSARFLKLDDGRFLALTERFRQRIQDLASFGDRRARQKLRFPPVRIGVLEDLAASVQLKSDQNWKDWVGRTRDAANLVPNVPSTLQTELRDYQFEGFQWLARLAAWGVGGCLADDMGLGKTIQALALLLHRGTSGPALVVAPTSVTFNWLTEIRRFAPTLNARVFGTDDRAAQLKQLGSRDVLICSYGLLHREAKRLQAKTWHTVVLDEAQAIKNVMTQRSRAAMGLQADFRLIMTGTPLENHLGELWNLFEFINPGLLGSLDSFQERFAQPIERDGCRNTRRRLKRLIQPFMLRRTKSQVLEELPPRTEVTLQVQLSEEEATFYEALRQRAIEELSNNEDGRPQHLKILAEIMRLRRACCHPRLVSDDLDIGGSKLALFSETVDELLANDHKVLVFSQFVDHLSILREELDRKNVSYQYLDGSTPAGQRKRRVEAFQAGEGDVFLISLKAGGLGLNLTAADYVMHMDPWWNPAVEDQASDRAHRLGQQRPVNIYRFITEGTIEERITKLHASKRDLADSLLEGADVSGKLTAEQLLQLIRE